MPVCEGFLYGLLGGALAEVLGLFKLRRQAPGSLPTWLRSWFYWLITGAMVLAGGALVAVYLKSGLMLSPILAVNVGASAPLIVGSLFSQAPQVEPGRTD